MATTTIEILRATRPEVIFDRTYFSWWAYGPALGHDVSYMPQLVADFARVPDARLVLLTASSEELRRRFERKPDAYFPLGVIQEANSPFPSLLEFLPEGLPRLHIDTTHTPPDDAFALVESFVGA